MLTTDSLFDGELFVFQEKSGYRFSIDSVLLAGLTRVGANDRVIDLGSGCGVIPLILSRREPGASYVGLEIQPQLAALAQKNVGINCLKDRITLLEMDFREVRKHLPAESFDLVISNPPYRCVHSGRINPNRQRAIARHEISGSVRDVFAAGKYLLATGGRLATIYPAERLDHLMGVAHGLGFSPKVLTVIYSDPSGPAKLVHLECRKGAGQQLRVEQPFYIYQEGGGYTQAMRKLYEE